MRGFSKQIFALAIVLVLIGLYAAPSVFANSGVEPPSYYSEEAKVHYKARVDAFERTRSMKGGILFVGDSITEGCRWNELLPGQNVLNQGIGWDTSHGVINRLHLVSKHKPSTIFLMIGLNDMNYNVPADKIVQNLIFIAKSMEIESPNTQIVIQSILPVDQAAWPMISSINTKTAQAVHGLGNNRLVFANIAPRFAPYNNTLKASLTYDGIHLNAEGCSYWASILK